MKCVNCSSDRIVKNGKSRHGSQRWLCRQCGKTCGERDGRRVEAGLRKAAIAHYLEGTGQRSIERLLGVSHNSVMNWVHEEVEGKALTPVPASEVKWVEADELWTFIGEKKSSAGSGGLLIALPRKCADGRWAIVAPRRPGSWMRSFLAAAASSSAPTSGTPTGSSSRGAATSRARPTPSP